MKLFLLSCLFLVSAACFGQNLVPNPSFEDTLECPYLGQVEFALGWQNPTGYSPITSMHA